MEQRNWKSRWLGRSHGVRREDRMCKQCGKGEVEDIDHFVMQDLQERD